jgi:hypothetical protein
MAELIYSLCALTSLACAGALLHAWQRTRHRLLMWSGWCFLGLFINNILLVLDKLAFPDLDLSVLRLVTALVSLCLLLYGLVYENP